MATLTGQTIAASYEQLLSLPDGGGNTSTLVAVTDGDGGTTFCISLTDASTGKAVLAVDGSHASGTEVQIDNSATDGDAFLSFQLSGTSLFTMGVDDGDSDKFKIGTTAIGTGTMFALDTSSRISLSNNDSGDNNTLFGYGAGASLDANSDENTFIGHNVSDASMSTALGNTAVGYSAASAITSGDYNTILGRNTGLVLSSGSNNVMVGNGAGATTTNAGHTVLIGLHSGGGGNIDSDADGTIAIGSSALTALTSGEYCIAIGQDALLGHTTGDRNIAIGKQAMDGTASVPTGTNNIAIGTDALGGSWTGTTSNNNTAIGHWALDANMDDGQTNVAIGNYALTGLIDGAQNIGIGYGAGSDITSGDNNIAIGVTALDAAVSGDKNIAIGSLAYDRANGSESNNMAIGYVALGDLDDDNATRNIAIGNYSCDGMGQFAHIDNVFLGYLSGSGTWGGVSSYNVGIGNNVMDAAMDGALGNVAIGHQALGAATTGDYNVCIGYYAGTHSNAITTGVQNTIIGANADVDAVAAANQTVIGYDTTSGGNNSVTLGNTSITDVHCGQDKQANVNCGQLTISDTGVSTTAHYVGLSNIHTKTGGDTDTPDNMTGLYSAMTFNHAEEFGNLMGANIQAIITTNGDGDGVYGIHANCKMDAGNVNDLFGGAFYVDGNDGSVDANVYGTYTDVQIHANLEVDGDVYGSYITVDDDDASAGDCYGLFINCLSNVDAAIGLAGGGIKFPATQAASANANTLDDYEEGTITNMLRSNGGTITDYTGFDVAGCKYVKIGCLVHIELQIDSQAANVATATDSGGSGALEVVLPFVAVNKTCRGSSAHGYNGSATMTLWWNLDGSNDRIQFYTDETFATTFDSSTTSRRMIFVNLTYSTN